MRRDDPARYTNNPPGGSCAATGKRSWLSRSAAKKVAKRVNPGEHMSSYRCPACGYWHNGHLPSGVVAGRVDRADLPAPQPKAAE